MTLMRPTTNQMLLLVDSEIVDPFRSVFTL